MSSVIFSSSDFEEKPAPSGRGSVWLSRGHVTTPLGPFSIECLDVPDDRLVAAVNEAVGLLDREHQMMLGVAYGLYQRAAEDRRWMKACGVPRDLSRGELADCISDRCVSAYRGADGHAKASISVRVPWDDEHRIVFRMSNGRLVLESP